MKKLENKSIELKFEEGKEMGFADLAKICLNQVPEGGIAPIEMSKRIAAIAKMDSAKLGEKIDLEESEFKMLKGLAETTGWRLIHADIVAFNDYLIEIDKK